MNNILILGGTGEGAQLAQRLVGEMGDRMTVTSSLAGRTAPPDLAGQIRVGGFGGVDGLAAYIKAETINAVVDATHPHAAQISAHAVAACQRTGTALLRLHRPPWREQPGDNWINLPDLATAAEWLELMAPSLRGPVLLTVGSGGVAPFRDVTNVEFIVRLLAEPSDALPLTRHQVVIGGPPYSEAGDADLFAKYGIGAVVSKNSGGAATEAKLAVARQGRIPVLMIDRPPLPPGAQVQSIDDAVAWVRDYLSSSS